MGNRDFDKGKPEKSEGGKGAGSPAVKEQEFLGCPQGAGDGLRAQVQCVLAAAR